MTDSLIKYLVEFLGSFFFLYVILAVVEKNSGFGKFGPVAIGLALMAAISLGGSTSGGHFNPAVSLMFALNNSFPWSDFGPYIASQLLGGIAAKYFFDLTHH